MGEAPTGMETIYDYPDAIHRRFASVDGYRTHYLEAGSEGARPVVLVHGANWDFGLGSDRWFPTMVPLSRDFHVFAPDELGGGETDPPRNLDDIGHIRVRAEHVLAFIEELGLGAVDLVGQSQGAWISAYIALRRPDLVQKIVLVDTASLSVPRGGIDDKDIASKFSQQHIPGTMVNRRIHEGDLKAGVWESLASMVYDPAVLIEPYVERCYELAERWAPIWREPWREFWRDGGARNQEQYLLEGVHPVDLVHRLQTPPLIVWGKNSVKGLQKGIDLFARIPDAQFHVFDKADHFLWQDQWNHFNSLVRWFLVDDGHVNG